MNAKALRIAAWLADRGYGSGPEGEVAVRDDGVIELTMPAFTRCVGAEGLPLVFEGASSGLAVAPSTIAFGIRIEVAP